MRYGLRYIGSASAPPDGGGLRQTVAHHANVIAIMSRTPEDDQFMVEMARQLDESIGKLDQREQVLVSYIGRERVEEIRELWDGTLDRSEEEELRRSLDWRDRELLWIWSRKRRAQSARTNVGQAFMKGGLSASDED
jgi:hypothetical protein